MEVKIDADELFELRRRVSDLEAQKREVDEEERRWFDFRLHSAVQFLKENNPDVPSLQKERDFWRSEALSVARTFEDMALKGISGQILVSIPMKDRARWHGYKLE